ncbi:hypothetical protein [Amycolatopsis pigmentata]|uniref:Methyltransferase domain-containing protein n=1 Tax=Amycolatopsis pigmentata TaxID=450801 RepID=A0ABW5FNY1_9PSEU
MSTREWLADTRISYDTVAESYADLVRDGLDRQPLLRGVLALFAELVKTNGPVADIGCGPGVESSPPTYGTWAWTPSASTSPPRCSRSPVATILT